MLIVILFTFWATLFLKPALATTYYVSANNGSDSNPGTISAPWQSLTKVSGYPLEPGDQILFQKNGKWNGVLSLTRSGTAEKPIQISAYGDGAKPIIEDSNSINGNKKIIYVRGDHLVFDNLKLQNSPYGFGMEVGTYSDISKNIKITNMEIANCKAGIKLYAENSVVSHNYIHDMVLMADDTSQSYGAIPMVIHTSNVEFSYNRTENSRAQSAVFGEDGGVVELYGVGTNLNNISIHHNWSKNSVGFLEGGSNVNPTMNPPRLMAVAENVTVHHNVIIDSGKILSIHLENTGEREPLLMKNWRIENNTFYDNSFSEGGKNHWTALFFSRNPDPGSISLTNIVFYTNHHNSIAPIDSRAWTNITRRNNLYFMANGGSLGFGLGPGEIKANPLLVNLSTLNFHLDKNSPAISGGLALEYSVDFDDYPIPAGAGAEIGAFEFVEGGVVLCPKKNEGDANCDGSVTLVDFGIWKKRYIK